MGSAGWAGADDSGALSLGYSVKPWECCLQRGAPPRCAPAADPAAPPCPPPRLPQVLNLEEGGAFTVSSADDILAAL